MATVDELIVVIRADTKQLQAGMARASSTTKTSTAAIERSLKTLEFQMTRVNINTRKMADDVSKSFNRVKRESDGLNKTIGRLGGAFQGLAALAVVRSVVRTATEFDSMRRALDAATGSADAGARSFDFIRQNANALGLDLLASARGFSQLAAAAKGTILEGQAVQDIFSGVSKAAAVMALSTADTNGVFRALSQVMSKGKVSAEELRGQMGERIPGAFQIAARAMGVTTSELDKMLSTGQLMSEDFLPRFAAQMEKEFGGAAEAAGTRAAASFARFNNSLVELQVAIGASGILDFLAKSAEIASKIMAPAFNAVATAVNTLKVAIASIAAQASAGLGKLVSFIDEDLGEKLIAFGSALDTQADKAADSAVESFRRMKDGVVELLEPTAQAIEQQGKLKDRTKELSDLQSQNKARQDELKTSQENLKKETKEYADRLKDVTEKYNPLETATQKYAKQAEAIENAFADGKIEASGYQQALDELRTEFAGNEEAMVAAINRGLKPYKDAQDKVKTATDAITTAQQQMLQAVKNSSEAMRQDDQVLVKQKNQIDAIADALHRFNNEADKAKRAQIAAEIGGLQGGSQDKGQFATGGSFVVGGAGGTDSQQVTFGATPGERVIIEAPGQPSPSGGGNTYNINVLAQTMNQLIDELTEASREQVLRFHIEPIFAEGG